MFWHNHTRNRQDALQAIMQTFNESNPYGITITQETQGTYTDIFRKMLGLLGTPEVPDLVVAYQNQAATYQLSDALVDMTSLLQSPKWGLSAEEQADFFPAFFRQDIFPPLRQRPPGYGPEPLDGSPVLQPRLAGRARLRRAAEHAGGVQGGGVRRPSTRPSARPTAAARWAISSASTPRA